MGLNFVITRVCITINKLSYVRSLHKGYIGINKQGKLHYDKRLYSYRFLRLWWKLLIKHSNGYRSTCRVLVAHQQVPSFHQMAFLNQTKNPHQF